MADLKRAAPFAFAALAVTPAHADPVITPLLTAVLGAQLFGTALFTVGAYTLTVGAVASALVTTAIGVALAVLLAPRPKTPTPESGIIAVMQPLPYRLYVYGRTRFSGAIMLKEMVAGYLCYVAALAGHFIDGFESLWLNDDEVSIYPVVAGSFVVGVQYTIATIGSTDFTLVGAAANTVGLVFTATGAGAGTGSATPLKLLTGKLMELPDGRYNNSIFVDTRQGLSPETYYGFISSLIPTEWTVYHRGDGQASLAMECLPVPAQNFTKTYPYAAPAPSVVARGYQVYDPRDGTQDPTNPATFKWSANAALCILHFLCFSEFGFRYPYATAIQPWLAQWIQAANDCEDAMPLKAGGTEPRYLLGGWITCEQARITTLLTMLQSCDGFISRRGSSYYLQIGKYYAPTVTLTDDDIAGFIIQTDVASEDKINEAIARYTSIDNGYVTVDTDPVVNAADQAARGGAPRKAQLELTWCQSTGQASRLLTREMYRQNVTVRGTLTIYWSGLNAVFERWIAVNSNTIPRLSGVVIENRKAVISPKNRTATIDFILSGPDLDAYDPSTQESAPPVIPQRPDTVQLPIPSNVVVVGALVTDATGASTVVLEVAWDEPLFNGAFWPLNYVLQWRYTAGPGAWVQQNIIGPAPAAGRIDVQSGVVPSGTSLDVQIAASGTTALGQFSATTTVSTVLANLAPQPPVWISATGSSGHAALSVTAPNSANFYGVQFWRAASGAPFSSASPIGAVVTGAPSSTVSYTDTVAAGTYDYFATSETSASVASAPVGPEIATVT